jgi:hypothetical protein
VFDDKVLRRIIGSNDWNVIESWKNVCNERCRDFYTSPSNTEVIKSRRMTWTGHVTDAVKIRSAHRILVKNLNERGQVKIGGEY